MYVYIYIYIYIYTHNTHIHTHTIYIQHTHTQPNLFAQGHAPSHVQQKQTWGLPNVFSPNVLDDKTDKLYNTYGIIIGIYSTSAKRKRLS